MMSPATSRNPKFDEIKVFEGVAERTGVTVDRSTARGSKVVCRSLTELSRKVRSQGDGHYYLASSAWPENVTRLVLTETWTPMG
jgi:hypothetical protein